MSHGLEHGVKRWAEVLMPAKTAIQGSASVSALPIPGVFRAGLRVLSRPPILVSSPESTVEALKHSAGEV